MRVPQIMEAYFARGHTARKRYVVVSEAIWRPGSSVRERDHKIMLRVVRAEQRLRFILALAMFFERVDEGL